MPIPLVTRILVADDHPIVRSGLKKVLDAQPDLEVVAEAADGAEAVKKALAGDVDLAILDVSMPRTTGIQAAEELRKRKPELRLLMLSMYDSEQFLFQSLKFMNGPLEAIGAVGLPALAVLALMLVPFVDRGRVQRVTRRTVAIAAVAPQISVSTAAVP